MKTISQWLLAGGVLAMAVACQPQKDKQGQNGGCHTSLEKPAQKSGAVENKSVTPVQPIQEKKVTASLEPKTVETEKTAQTTVLETKPAPQQAPAPVSAAPTAAAEGKPDSAKNATLLNQVKSETPASSSSAASSK